MSKVGRNDPCPCGSGKKHKQCCLGAPAPSLLSRLPEVIEDERTRAEAVARRWLGVEGDAAPPLRDKKGRKLVLVMDRYHVDDASAVRQVRALGRDEGDRVLFFDGDQWIGEADLSLPEELILVSPRPELSDRLVALLRGIASLRHRDRQVDELAELGEATSGGGAGLLDFKKTFFTAWLDEPNQKLGGGTPREAAGAPHLRPDLLRLLDELEQKEARLPREERYSFCSLRRDLGL